MSLKLFNI